MSAIALVEDYLNGRNDPLKAVKESLDHCERAVSYTHLRAHET